jgi:type 2 lantibiotic biosynthesis protein LanM
LRFAGGQRLVYKPRSLAIDQHFQELLLWLNRQGAQPPFRPLTILNRQEYGWVEFVAATPCTNAAEVERFYQRQGGYLALLHALNAADFHFENLIAAGEHPMLIDLEALFHPDIMAYDPNDPGQLAQQALDQSVLSVGMLPQRLQFHAGAAAIDISGIGGNERQLTPDKLPVWEGVGTDEMRLTRRHVEFSSSGHRPQLAGAPIDVRTQADAVAQGFAQIYDLLLTHRAALLAPDGPLVRFANDEIRVVARATRTYALLLQESSHPDLLRNALDQDRLYTRLWKDVATAPQLARLLPAERRDLHSGDVPIFLAQPALTHLWDSAGQIIPYFLAESGMTRVQRRIAAMDETDLTRQLWYIHASFATLTGGHHHSKGNERPTQTHGNAEMPTRDLLLSKARAIGDHLIELAHRHGDHAVWIGLGLDEKESWSLTPLTMHLYDGHAGLAFFFAYLGHITGEENYTKLAEAALATTLAQAEPLQANFSYIGGFSGWGGLIYILTHLGQLWQRPDLWEKAIRLVDVATQFVDQDEQFDVIGGAAGCIAATAALYRCTGNPRALALIKHCAVHLVAQAQPMPSGVGWVVPNMGGQPLAGFSHGAAGIAWALFTAADLCDNPYYRHIAEEALRYERSLFAPAVGNWVDLRTMAEGEAGDQHEEKFMHAWCHGAPGIGLARLALISNQRDPLLRDEIEAALHSTASAGFGGGHSLCHGDLGNLELFVKAATVLGQEEWLAKAHQLVGAILNATAATGWRCGVPGGVETPGLMTGLAGIGYELLRLADPAKTPSLLLMEGPQ